MALTLWEQMRSSELQQMAQQALISKIVYGVFANTLR